MSDLVMLSTAEQGATGVIATINRATESGIYHAFGHEALYKGS